MDAWSTCVVFKWGSVSQIRPSPPSLRCFITHESFLCGATNTLYSYPGLKSWTSSAFRRLLSVLTAGWILLSFTICCIPQSRRASVARSASSCSHPLAPLSSSSSFLISPLECDLWWPWPALLGILHTWRDLNRAPGPFYKGHSFPLA